MFDLCELFERGRSYALRRGVWQNIIEFFFEPFQLPVKPVILRVRDLRRIKYMIKIAVMVEVFDKLLYCLFFILRNILRVAIE